MFVEIAQYHGRPRRVALKRKLDRVQLTPPRRPKKPKMNRNHAQGAWSFQIGNHGPTRLMPRKVKPVQPAKVQSGPGQKRIAMPAQACGIPPDGQRFQTRHLGDPIARQGRRPRAKAEISLLQSHDIGLQCRDPGQHPIRIPPEIRPQSGADIPGRKPKPGL